MKYRDGTTFKGYWRQNKVKRGKVTYSRATSPQPAALEKQKKANSKQGKTKKKKKMSDALLTVLFSPDKIAA